MSLAVNAMAKPGSSPSRDRRPLGAPAEATEAYGRDKAKFSWEFVQQTLAKPLRRKPILMTAVNPALAGEVKTTTPSA